MDGRQKLAESFQVIEEAVAVSPAADLAVISGNLERLRFLISVRSFQGPEVDNRCLLTPTQVAERLNVPKSFVYEAARQKELESVRLGKKHIRFTEVALKAFQEKCRR